MAVKLNEQIAKLDAVSPIKRTIKHAAEIAELKYRKGAMQRKVDSNAASIDDMNELGRIEKKIVVRFCELFFSPSFFFPPLFLGGGLGALAVFKALGRVFTEW